MTTPQPTWTTSSFCSVGACVSVAHTDNTVMVRHIAHPDGTTLTFSREEWKAFLAGVRAGEFDVTPAEGVGAATPAEHEDEPRHEVECPQCGATIRARMADAPDEEGAGVVRLLARCEELDRETLNRRTHGGGLLPATLSTAEVRALLSGGEQT